MPITTSSQKVKDHLSERAVDYEIVNHPQCFSTIEEARELNIQADEIAKSLMVYDRGIRMMFVVPGGHMIDSKKLRQFGSKHARLASEEELSEDFAEYELGAIPPLSELIGVPVLVDRRLLEHNTIIFNAGTHRESVKMDCTQFIALNDAKIVDVAGES